MHKRNDFVSDASRMLESDSMVVSPSPSDINISALCDSRTTNSESPFEDINLSDSIAALSLSDPVAVDENVLLF